MTSSIYPFALSAAKGLTQTSQTPRGRRLKRGDSTVMSSIYPFALSAAKGLMQTSRIPHLAQRQRLLMSLTSR